MKPLFLGGSYTSGQDMLFSQEDLVNLAAEYKICPYSLSIACFEEDFGLYKIKTAEDHQAFITGESLNIKV